MSKTKASKGPKEIDARLLAKARTLVRGYGFTMTLEDGWWYAFGIELSGAAGGGKTEAEALKDLREAMACVAAVMIESGQELPQAGREEARTEQINLRVSPTERLMIEAAAKRSNYPGTSDYLRTLGLSATTTGMSTLRKSRQRAGR